MKNFEWCVYTYKHRLAFLHVARLLIKDEELLSNILDRAKVHDIDKQLLYLFIPYEEAIEYHVHHKSHHLESGMQKSYEDWLEMVIDYECAPYTKPDKPLNCYDFVHKLVDLKYMDNDTAGKLYEIMHMLGIDYSYDVTKEEQCINFLKTIPEITEEMILLEVMDYVKTNPVKELEYIHNRLKRDS